jgi:hypothetical protein
MKLCIYCDSIADGVDHPVPVSRLVSRRLLAHSKTKRYGKMVPCCANCNSMLGNKLFKFMEDRFEFVADRLEVRYSNLLNMPLWSTDELDELGPSMRSAIEADLSRKERIQNRIKFARGQNRLKFRPGPKKPSK